MLVVLVKAIEVGSFTGTFAGLAERHFTAAADLQKQPRDGGRPCAIDREFSVGGQFARSGKRRDLVFHKLSRTRHRDSRRRWQRLPAAWPQGNRRGPVG